MGKFIIKKTPSGAFNFSLFAVNKETGVIVIRYSQTFKKKFITVKIVVNILAKNIAPQEIHIDNYLTQTVVYTLSAYSLWNIIDIFIERIKPRAIYRRSFAIYAMHLNVGIIILKIFSFCTPQNEWLEIPKFIVMIISTLIIINFVCAFLEKFAPKIYAVLMGNRINKKT